MAKERRPIPNRAALSLLCALLARRSASGASSAAAVIALSFRSSPPAILRPTLALRTVVPASTAASVPSVPASAAAASAAVPFPRFRLRSVLFRLRSTLAASYRPDDGASGGPSENPPPDDGGDVEGDDDEAEEDVNGADLPPPGRRRQGGGARDERVPRTGWTHSRPGPYSDLWSSSSSAPARTRGGRRGDGSRRRGAGRTEREGPAGVGEPRTGWLHNTAPPKRDQGGEEEGGGTAGVSSAKVRGGGAQDARRLLRLEVQKKMRNHRIVCPPTLHPCGDGRRVAITEHRISVPLRRPSGDFAGELGGGVLLSEMSSGPTVDIFFTVVELVKSEDDERFFSVALSSGAASYDDDDGAKRDRAEMYVRRANLTNADGMVLYLQGGPGFGSPHPVTALSLSEKGSWASEALDSSSGFERVVLMDQRGTGRSTPITKQTLERAFPNLFALDDAASSAERKDGRRDGWGDSTASGRRIAEQLDRWESVNPDLAARVGVGLGQAADYLANFRADDIVRDAEDVRDALLVPAEDGGGGGGGGGTAAAAESRPWGAALGQSFGGFCVMTYLSLVPRPPRICLITGGLAPMLSTPLEVYDRLWDRVRERSLLYYERYPGDVHLVKRIVRRLLDTPAPLPSGGTLTARRFLQLGIGLGGSPSAFASLHSLLGSALLDDGPDVVDAEFTRSFLKRIESEQPFDDHPLYFLLHESIYADGARPGHSPTDWAAHQSYESRMAGPTAVASGESPPPDFDYNVTSHPSDARPTLFFGEMVFPWMAEGDYAELGGFGMRALAHSLASRDDWEPLYDEDAMRRALAPGGPVRAAAAVYYDDMYVDFDCSMALVRRGGPMEGCRVWITNEYQHSGLRDDGASVFSRLLGMAKGSVGTPS